MISRTLFLVKNIRNLSFKYRQRKVLCFTTLQSTADKLVAFNANYNHTTMAFLVSSFVILFCFKPIFRGFVGFLRLSFSGAAQVS